MRRYRESGKFPNAYKDTDRQWRVPVEDLLASGLTLSGQAQPEQASMPSEHPREPAPEPLSERVRELEGLLAVERARAAGLERVAAAAEANAADLRMALRMIEATRPGQGEQVHVEPVTTPTEQAESAPHGQGEQGEQGEPDQAAEPRRGDGVVHIRPRAEGEPAPRRRWWQWGSGSSY